jgi:FAD/FMN-containing dehydrogenase
MHRRDVLRAAASAAALTTLPGTLAWADDAPAINLDGQPITLDRGDIRAFAETLHGIVIRPDGNQYDLARQVWNRIWDKRPALIVRVASVDDVRASVNFAREKNLLTAVRCGGHSMSGKSVCDGGLVIDLGYLNDVDIDVERKIATVGGGALLGDLDRKALPLGLATTAGVVSHTGAGGLILGGGLGRLQRRFGLAIDNIVGVELVTADGRVVQAAADENPDLYWGVRGGGGNFGVVTKLFMRLHDMSPMVANFVFSFPAETAKDALRLYFEYTSGADPDLFVIGSVFMNADGQSGVRFIGNYFGPNARLDRVLAPLRKFGKASSEAVFPIEYVKIQQAADDGFNAPGNRHYSKGGFLRAADDRLIDAIVENLEPLPGRRFSISLLPMDGAPAEIAANATPWTHRDALYNIDSSSAWPVNDAESDARNIAWNRAYWPSIEPFTRGFYVNGLMDQTQAQVNANYGPNYARLVAVKNAWDPTNLFRLNANVRPTV